MRSPTRRLFQGIAVAAVVAACARYSAEGYRPADDDAIGSVPAHEVARAMREARMVGPTQPFDLRYEELEPAPHGLKYHCFAYPDGGRDVGLVDGASEETVCSWRWQADGGPGIRVTDSLRGMDENQIEAIKSTCDYLWGSKRALSRFHVDEAGNVRLVDANARPSNSSAYASVSVVCPGTETLMRAFYDFGDGDADQRLLVFRHACDGGWDLTHVP